MQVTQAHIQKVFETSKGSQNVLDICNKAIEMALAEQSQEQPDSGGWVTNTGTQPVADDVEVEIMMRSEIKSCDVASNLRWDFDKNLGGDITHWRLAKQEQPLISAEEAGNAELLKALEDLSFECFSPVGGTTPPSVEVYNRTFRVLEKYRAIKQPEPVEPHAELFYRSSHGGIPWFEGSCVTKNHPSFEWSTKASIDAPICQVRNLDTGELKTMTREKAKLLQAELGDAVEWFFPNGLDFGNHFVAAFEGKGVYTYKLKGNLVKLDGELMTRKAAIAKWESQKDTCDVWYTNYGQEFYMVDINGFVSHSEAHRPEYQLRPKPLKQVSWTGSREDVIALVKDMLLTGRYL